MNPFDNYIESMLQSGKSMESIADEMSRALNAARKKQEEREKNAREMEKVREGLIDMVNAAVDVNSFDFKVAAASATLAAIDSHGGWTKQEADDYYTKVYRLLMGEPNAETDRCATVDPINKLFETIAPFFGEVENKSKESKAASDAERINRWLRELGLK